MRLKGLVVGCGVLLLVIAGFTPYGLPFLPGATFSDAVTSHWGAALFTRETVLSGEYPLWRETILGGMPFAANPLNKTAYPLQWLVLILPATVHLNVMIVLHVALAGVGMWQWARVHDIREEGAALAVLAYMLSPRLVAHLGAGHLDIVYALGWLPWLMWLLHRGTRDEGATLYTLKLALVAGMVLLADVRVSLFGFAFGAAYVLWRAAVDRDVMRIGWSAVAVVPFLLLVAGGLVPLLGWQPYLSRSLLTAAEAGALSVQPVGLMGLLLPPHEAGNNILETMVYVGTPTLVLAVIGLLTRPLRQTLFWLGVVVFFGLWALGTNGPLWSALATFEPLRWFRVPGRAWLVVMLSASLLAGYGLQALLNITGKWHGEDDDPPKYFFWLRLLAAASAGIFAICGATMLTTTMLELTPSTAALMLFNGVALGVVLLVVLLQRGREPIVATSLLLITFADVAVTGAQWLEWRGYDDWLEPHAELAEALRDFPAARIYSPDYALPQPVAEVYGLQLFYGVDPFQLQGMVQAIETASGVPVDGYSIVLPPLTGIEGMDEILQVNRSYTPNPRILAAWGVSHIISGYEYDLPSLTPLETIDGIHIYLNQAYIQLDADEAAAQDALSLLPTPDEIEVLHRRTLAAVWVSAASFVFVGGGIAYLSVRKAGNSEE